MVAAASGGVAAVLFLVYVIVIVVEIAAMWKVFEKADRPGWGAIVPFYNAYLLCEIVGFSGWMMLLLFIPFVNIVFALVLYFKLAAAFNKGVGFGVGLALLSFIFAPILGFGSSQYVG